MFKISEPFEFEKIMNYLDHTVPFSTIMYPVTNNSVLPELVTIQMTVCHEDRLYLRQCQQQFMDIVKMMYDTDLELNIGSNGRLYDNNVSVQITGPPMGALYTYLAVRDQLPIIISFNVKLYPNVSMTELDPESATLKAMQQQYEFELIVMRLVQSNVSTSLTNHSNQVIVYIRINRHNENSLHLILNEIRQYIDRKSLGQMDAKVQSTIDIPAHRPDILGRGYSLIEPIRQRTQTELQVKRSAYNSSMIEITGHNCWSVREALREISDRFVVELDFEVNERQSTALNGCAIELGRLSDEHSVHILMKPNQYANPQTVLVRGTDSEVHTLFRIRNQVLDLADRAAIATVANRCSKLA